jgi:KaiC/GvpD/RAD55 family RecA-like ATPase
MIDRGISLGGYLDYILNRTHNLGEKPCWGIRLPYGGDPGSGNIVICGKAGSGKSTLALQIAVACTRDENDFAAGYVSLEESPEALLTKAGGFGWKGRLREVRHLHAVDDAASPKDLSEILAAVITQPGGVGAENPCLLSKASNDGRRRIHCDYQLTHNKNLEGFLSRRDPKSWQRRVLLFSLSPASLVAPREEGTLFQERYRQLDRLLTAAEVLNMGKSADGSAEFAPVLPLVCVDSLNIFGSGNPVREEIHRLFDLFRRHKIIGVFTVEAGAETPFDSTMADVVISLTTDKDQGYVVQYLEVEKSRYFPQAPGRHTFKILSLPRVTPAEQSGVAQATAERLGQWGIVVYPSLHWHISSTDPLKKEPRAGPIDFDLGAEGFNHILPRGIHRGSVVTIEGERGTFKTAFAINFLAKGLCQGENALLISLADRPQLTQERDLKGELEPDSRMIAEELRSGEAKTSDHLSLPSFRWENLKAVTDDEERQKWSAVMMRQTKGQIRVWENSYPDLQKESSGAAKGRLIEVNFKSGMLLPEEFVHIVCKVLENCPLKDKPEPGKTAIRRVVLDDVSLVGLSYPFLRRSNTTGDLFLSAFVHLMRNYDVDLVMTGTTGDLPDANEAVRRAVSLADAVVTCRYSNVFGERYVTVRGQGLMLAGDVHGSSRAESIPAVVRRFKGSCTGEPDAFRLDRDELEGLVGFETGEIHRPGLLLYVFSEYAKLEDAEERKGLGDQERYNALLETLVKSAFGRPTGILEGPLPPEKPGVDVAVSCFNSVESEAVHDSLRLLAGGPIDRTVLFTLDEFWATEERSTEFLTTVEEENLDPVDRCMRDRDHHIVWWNKPAAVWPYCANVLLLAYRTDLAERALAPGGGNDWVERVLRNPRQDVGAPTSWKDVEVLADALGQAAGKEPQAPQGGETATPPAFKFWFDRAANETLACALMDALIVRRRAPRSYDGDKPPDYGRTEQQNLCEGFVPQLEKILKDKDTAEEVNALWNLFYLADTEDRSRRLLVPDAGLYLCWYSQLRDLIDRVPSLAGVLNVCALPGGGFTGDWFVGIAKGSVSKGLGRKVLKLLCSQEEQYKRFVMGVGLPTLRSFYKETEGTRAPKFFAWPRGWEVPVSRIRDIHAQALSRSFIEDYTKFRSALATVASRLTPMYGLTKPEWKGAWDNVSRLPNQIGMLKGLQANRRRRVRPA